mmetsp:Transcript_15273/g.40319  ORF Transcript_15273/g.40319 Transcript_15273/m.40319 type:complete len:233 (+) Transcript_15273:988-1686(+)
MRCVRAWTRRTMRRARPSTPSSLRLLEATRTQEGTRGDAIRWTWERPTSRATTSRRRSTSATRAAASRTAPRARRRSRSTRASSRRCGFLSTTATQTIACRTRATRSGPRASPTTACSPRNQLGTRGRPATTLSLPGTRRPTRSMTRPRTSASSLSSRFVWLGTWCRPFSHAPPLRSSRRGSQAGRSECWTLTRGRQASSAPCVQGPGTPPLSILRLKSAVRRGHPYLRTRL